MEFPIYIRSDKFYWTNNKIIYSIVFSCLAAVFIHNGPGIIQRNFINNVLMFLILSAFIAGLILKSIGFTRIAPLKGKLDGYIIFNKDFIQAKDEIFPIDTIYKIKISNDDYYGKLARFARGHFGPALSNGTNNFVVLFLKSYQTKNFQFELRNSDDFQKIRETLIDYHIKKKIDFWELAKILREKSTSETLELTAEIKKRDTTANSR